MSADPTVIGPYKRTREIGRGSFATVYEGYHATKKQMVAIKSIYKGRLNKKVRENLTQEIEILKQLNHPHVVHLLDFHETPRDMHIVLEYCLLGDLTTFIRRRDHIAKHRTTRHIMARYPNPRHGGLHEVLARHFLQQLATAIRFLRARGLVHRDLKPQNLLLLPPPAYADGKHAPPAEPLAGLRSLPMLKVADFGFARPLAEASLADTMCGSPLYMAPEILRLKGYGAEADLWSIGTVLYEMVTAKPPFRATNHLDLIHKIEAVGDNIRFPENVVVSGELKAFIRGLLKYQPTQRMTFEEFFSHNVVTGIIPGLVEGDEQVTAIPPPAVTSRVAEGQSESSARPRRTSYAEQPTLTPIRGSFEERNDPTQTTATRRRQSSINHFPPPPTHTPPSSLQRTASHPPLPSPTPSPQTRGPLRKHSTELEAEARRNAKALAARRELERERIAREERTAMDIALERDYIFVEKRSVEVNSLADAFAEEMAVATTAPRAAAEGRHGTAPSSAVGQRGRKQSGASDHQPAGSLGSATSDSHRLASSPVAHSKALAIRPSAAQKENDPDALRRKISLERKFGYSPTSATNALSKALNMATGRLFGYSLGGQGAGNASRNGRRSPYGYNPFPTYPLSSRNIMMDGHRDLHMLSARSLSGNGQGKAGSTPLDEDTRVLQVIEECATRSDVVYGFAEVKFKQLVPSTPSEQPDISGANGHLREEPYYARISGEDEREDELTNDAVITLSEEALVLYVKTLSLLAKSMDIAGAWWVRKNMPPTPPSSYPSGNSAGVIGTTPPTTTTTTSLVVVGNQVNNVVQWVRKRFNEVLDKAEYCRKRLLSAQQRLPAAQRAGYHEHGAHEFADTSPSAAMADQIASSSGVTAEALMYNRANEMSRSAAINELTQHDLPGCEMSYITALRMLEAVLETDYISDSGGMPSPSASGSPSTTAATVGASGTAGGGPATIVNGLQPKEREVVISLITATRERLKTLQAKMAKLQQHAQQQQQPSSHQN